MENEEVLLNFMEVSNLSYEDAKRRLEEAGYNFELAIQQYYDSQQETEELPPNIPEEEPEVRPVIPRSYDILVEEDSRRNVQLCRVGRQFVSSFRDLKREMEIQEEIARGQTPKKKCLEDIYRHPLDITLNFDFNYAKIYGQKVGKWVAVLINNENFESLSFNRDFFNEPSQKAKRVLKENFVFIRKNSNDIEALTIMGLYNLSEHQVPILLVIDSLTGELKKNIGECNKLSLSSVLKELKKFSTGKDKELLYNSAYEGSDDEIDTAVTASISYASTSKSTLVNKPSTSQTTSSTKVTKYESDEESFASISTNDGDIPEDNENEEPKILESDDEVLKSDDGPQTNILLKLQDENHKFKYPAKRTVGQLINYIYRNYLLPTGVYDNKTKRFSLFSKIHNSCLTSIDNDKSLEDSKIHPSIVLMHSTIDKD